MSFSPIPNMHDASKKSVHSFWIRPKYIHTQFELDLVTIWENQMEPDVRKFLNMLKQRLQDIYIQECYSSIENKSRCMLYKHLKPVYSMEHYLKCNYHRDLRQYLTNAFFN